MSASRSRQKRNVRKKVDPWEDTQLLTSSKSKLLDLDLVVCDLPDNMLRLRADRSANSRETRVMELFG